MTSKNDHQKKNDTMLKVIAVVCAVLLWFYAEAQENTSRQLSVPIQYVNLASGYVVEGDVQFVQVSIRGKDADIVSLRSDDFTAVVDMTDAQVGSNVCMVHVTGETVTERFSYTPNQVTVVVDQLQQKEVPVRVRTDGAVAQQYALKDTDVQPNVVTIRGKSKQIADITAVETQIIDLSGITGDTIQQAALHLPDGVTAKVGEGAFTTNAQVTVAFHVQSKLKTMILEPKIALRNVPQGLTAALDPKTATMTLQGNVDYMNSQPFMDLLLLHVDCSNLEAGTHTLPIQVEASSEEVQSVLQSIEPQTVTVTLTSEDGSLPDGDIPVNGNGAQNSEINDIENNTNTAA